MPFYKFDSTFKLDQSVTFDFTIIGAGAAGICLAVNLSKQGKKVMLIESGEFDLSQPHQQLNKVVETGKKMNGVFSGRNRAIGGTTNTWGGQSLPFSPIDFEERSWLSKNKWPISFQEIYPYYGSANIFMGIQNQDYFGEKALGAIKLINPGFAPNTFDYHISKWVKEPNFRKLYANELNNNIFILYNASLNKIKEKNGQVENIEIINLDLHRYCIPVNQLIIAAGGLESNRILLMHPELFTSFNNFSLLGKGFMDHPCLDLGYIESTNPFKLQRYFNTHLYKGYKQSIRLSTSATLQKEKEILNGSVSLFFSPNADIDFLTELSSFRKQMRFSTLLKLLTRLGGLPNIVYAYLAKSFIFKSNAKPIISLMVEQESTTSSYLALCESIDELLQPKLEVHWDIEKSTWKTVMEIKNHLKLELDRLGFGKVIFYKHIHEDNPMWKNLLSDVNHHMGGIKMSETPQTGLVDSDLKVWGINNLYVASTAVFPTSSHSNPTLTLLALCHRLSNYLTTNIS